MGAVAMDGVPARLGRFAIERRLAIGGMAEIFLARATGIEGFEKQVVVKRILPHLAADDDFVAMFLDEARLAAQLHHPNVGQVYDIGEENGVHFFAMEYIHGRDVRDLLKRAATSRNDVPLQHVLTIIAGAAAGLHHAHEATSATGEPLALVHRDVSPSNILVTFTGGVKVVDFGIAKAAARAVETNSGTLKGKFPYMSPEQTTGKTLDRRSDVFSLGVVLYELLTTSRLFTGASDFEVMTKIASGDVPPPSSRAPRVDPDLEAVVLRALESRPDDRYASAEELLEAIEGYAARARIALSALALSRYLREVFGDEAAAPPEPPSSPSVESVEIEVEEASAVTVSTPREDGVVSAPLPTQTSHQNRIAAASRRRWRVPLALALVAVLGGGVVTWAVTAGGSDDAQETTGGDDAHQTTGGADDEASDEDGEPASASAPPAPAVMLPPAPDAAATSAADPRVDAGATATTERAPPRAERASERARRGTRRPRRPKPEPSDAPSWRSHGVLPPD